MKNQKIFIRNVFLILFFLIIIFLLYLLYVNHYFNSSSHSFTNTTSEKTTIQEDHDELSLDELKEKYSSYIDPYVLSEQSIYLKDFYEGHLTAELKNYFALIQMDFSKISVEDDYNEIDESDLKEICSSLFEKCEKRSFDYNGNKVRYFEKLGSYITTNVLERNDSMIRREIIDIKEENNTVRITTVEAVVDGEQIYSVYPNEWISEYYDEGLVNYSDSLNRMVYTFQNQKLISIEKG